MINYLSQEQYQKFRDMMFTNSLPYNEHFTNESKTIKALSDAILKELEDWISNCNFEENTARNKINDIEIISNWFDTKDESFEFFILIYKKLNLIEFILEKL